MGQAYGFIEVSGVTAAVDCLDQMVKTADVEFVTWERKLGGRLVTVVVQGEVSAVKQAVEAGCTRGIKKPVASYVIANPHEETEKMVRLSASRVKGKSVLTPADIAEK